MAEESPLVSIVVPVYNGAPYLRKAIDSILQQDYPNIELIAVDDGSTDETPDILESYGERIRLVRQKNAGQSVALNTGWSMSAGSVLGYLSADDVLYPSAVRRSVEFLQEHPEMDATYCDYELISPSSDVTGQVRMELNFAAMLERLQIPMGPGAFFRKAIYAKVGGWNVDYYQSPDVDFWLRVASSGNVGHIDELLAGFRMHPGSTSFRKADPWGADEPIRIVEGYFHSACSERAAALRDEARSTARVLAARAHLRAGRYRAGLKRLRQALVLSPRRVLTPYSLRILASGVLGQLRHRALWRLAKRRTRKST